ncbi:MAG: synthase subcomplex alpha subunit, partial [Pseudonocardia sp.]|nr:synthase subcomplex alpha subunit [Pseudonocardia sp.]
EEQVISIYAGTSGALDDIEVEQVKKFETELLEFFRTRHAAMLELIRTTGDLPDEALLKQAVDEFKTLFLGRIGSDVPAGGGPKPGDAEVLGEPESPETLATE